MDLELLIEVTNYQKVREAKFKLQGLTLITADHNNAGKTACMRAIRDLVLNSPPNYSFTKDKINNRSKSGSVAINELKLEVTKKGTSLTNGVDTWNTTVGLKPFDNFNTTTGNPIPFLIINNAKIKNCLPQFSFHREKDFELFPFNLSPYQIYYVFSMLYDIDLVSRVQLETKTEVNMAEGELELLKIKLDDLIVEQTNVNKQLSKYPSQGEIEKMEFEYQNNLQILDSFKERRGLILGLRILDETLIQTKEALKLLQYYEHGLNVLDKIKEYKKQKFDLYMYELQLEEFNTKIEKLEQAQENLAGIDFESAEVSIVLSKICLYNSYFIDIQTLTRQIFKIKQSINKCEEAEAKINESVKAWTEIEETRTKIEAYKQHSKDLMVMTGEIVKVRNRLKEAETEMKELGVCDVCGAEAEHWHIQG